LISFFISRWNAISGVCPTGPGAWVYLFFVAVAVI
jgi:hypothetical protein